VRRAASKLLLILFCSLSVQASENALSLPCEAFIVRFPQEWQEDFRMVLTDGGQPLEVTEQNRSRTSLSISDGKLGIIQRGIADELLSSGIKTPRQIKIALEGFYALDAEQKIRFAEYVAERIVNALETQLTVTDLPAVEKEAISHGMEVHEYMKFLGYFKSNYSRDPTLAELKFAILFNLLYDAKNSAKAVAQTRSLRARLADWFRRRPVSCRVADCSPRSERDIAQDNATLRRLQWQQIAAVSTAGRDYFFRSHYLKLAISELSYALEQYGSELTPSTRQALITRKAQLESVLVGRVELAADRERLTKLQSQRKKLGNIQLMRHGEYTSADKQYLKAHLEQIDSYNDANQANAAFKEIVTNICPKMNSADFMYFFRKAIPMIDSYHDHEPTNQGIAILYEGASHVKISANHKAEIIRLVKGITSSYNDSPSAEEVLALLRKPWGLQTEHVPEEVARKIEQADEELETLGKAIAEREAKLAEAAKALVDSQSGVLN
jgi:hypothetical protein